MATAYVTNASHRGTPVRSHIVPSEISSTPAMRKPPPTRADAGSRRVRPCLQDLPARGQWGGAL
jgi:hypothetical protein